MALDDVMIDLVDGVKLWLKRDIQFAMNRINTRRNKKIEETKKTESITSLKSIQTEQGTALKNSDKVGNDSETNGSDRF